MTNQTDAHMASGEITAAVLVIGDEILSGRTQDANIAEIARQLGGIGIDLREARVIGDDHEAIVEAVNALRARHTYLFTTGGIGPTHDDITAEAIAASFGVALPIDERAVAAMEPFYREKNLPLNETRLRMARIPVGADLVANPVSAAPGFWIGNVIVMAGIPSIVRGMLADVVPKLRRGVVVHSRNVHMLCPESQLADFMAELQAAHPGISVGSYPYVFEQSYRTNVVVRGRDRGGVDAAAAALLAHPDADPKEKALAGSCDHQEGR